MVVPDVFLLFYSEWLRTGKKAIFVVTPVGFAQGFTTAFGRAAVFRGAKAPRLIPKSKDMDKTSRKQGQRQELPKGKDNGKAAWVRFTPALRICKTVRVCLLRTNGLFLLFWRTICHSPDVNSKQYERRGQLCLENRSAKLKVRDW
jgi:hypothetical protein